MSQCVPGVHLTRVHAIVAPPQQVGELLAAFALAVAPRRVEAQLLHQHQRLLTQFFIPVPRHPPIRIALLTSSRSQRWRGPRRPCLSDGARPPHARLAVGRKGGRRSGGGGGWITGTRFPCMSERHPSAVPLSLQETKWEEVGVSERRGQRGVQIKFWQRGHLNH